MIVELTGQQQATADADEDRQHLLELLTSAKMELANKALDHEQQVSTMKKEHAAEKNELSAKVARLGRELEGAMSVVHHQQEEYREHMQQAMEELAAATAAKATPEQARRESSNMKKVQEDVVNESPSDGRDADDKSPLRIHSAPPTPQNNDKKRASNWPEGFDIDQFVSVDKSDDPDSPNDTTTTIGTGEPGDFNSHSSFVRVGSTGSTSSIRRSGSLGSLDSFSSMSGSFHRFSPGDTLAMNHEDDHNIRESRFGKLGKGARQRFLKFSFELH